MIVYRDLGSFSLSFWSNFQNNAFQRAFIFPQISARKTQHLAALKLIPQWVALFLLKSGIAHLFSSIFRLVGISATAFADSLTSNKDLHLIFNYFFYGKKVLNLTKE